MGIIQSDGFYELSYLTPGDGAMPGEYSVAIDAQEITSSSPRRTSFGQELAERDASQLGEAPKFKWLIPEEYSSKVSSGLTRTVEDKTNVINFDL